MLSRQRRVNRFKLYAGKTLGSHVKRVYYIKNVYYGHNVDSYVYHTVKATHATGERVYKKNKNYKKSDFAIQRARERLYRIVEANAEVTKNAKKKSIFFTLTTIDQIKDFKESNTKIKGFIRRLRKYPGASDVGYLLVPELHKSGAIHYHGVFFNVPFIGVKYFRFSLWKQGYVDLQIPRKIKSVSAYLSKYLTEDTLQNLTKNDKTYFTSRNLILPVQTLDVEHPSDTIEITSIQKFSQGVKITYKCQI